MTRSDRKDKKAWAAYMREYYHTHPEYAAQVRAAAKARHRRLMEDPDWRERERARSRAKARRDREAGKVKVASLLKRRARWTLRNAVRDGVVKKSSVCKQCGRDDVGRIEGHHSDYTKPLEILWLCSLCHGKEHRKAG
jgi:hypothetical protein